MLVVKQINPEDTYQIRHTVLRPNQTINDCKYDDDFNENAFHLGAFLNGKLISIASYYEEQNKSFDGKIQYRLRGMATLNEFRNLRAGSALIEFAETILNDRLADLWWCNARISASSYYEKLGLSVFGDVFIIDPIGPHKLMWKKIAGRETNHSL
ncbi:GNAT family N-acetyltransferase [Sporosarcina sp. Marseille-Q4063]|uniref:GNAT family N-acetyltransferase n=1 Tax=Sporosarcina sp. Marseille-Q4063 TaxID=2810514 RepID=UPI001BAFDF98|nr:GNAT family N-acetyltransferase [Sporosarcina sp. Marseille-Q4063]QUW22802.1 GNAT family N-acetyltransferase [Sporosarcina sp. Marseille-Q4063]